MLSQDGGGNVVEGVSFNNNRFIWVNVQADWCGGEGRFEGVKGLLSFDVRTKVRSLWVNCVTGLTIKEKP